MKKLIFVIITLCIAQFSFSQSDFRKGYVVTNAGDTLFGLVDFREGVKAYRSCDFKRSEDQNSTGYQPGDIVGYGFQNDKIFRSKEVSIKDQPSASAFLEVVVDGPVSLYKVEDAFFIEKEDKGLQELINETKEVYVDGRRTLRSNNQYIGTLNMQLFDCPEVRGKLQKVRLAEKELTDLIENYNQCKGQATVTYKAKKPWSKATIGITGGASISEYSADTHPLNKHLGGAFEGVKSPIIGISFDIFAPRLSERLSFHADIFHLTSKYYSYRRFNGSFHTERHYVTLELQQVKIPIGLRYTLPERKFTPYISAGVSATTHLSSNSTWIQEIEVNNLVETDRYVALPIKKNQFGFWGSGGIVVPIHEKLQAFFELRYERTGWNSQTALNPDVEVRSGITNVQILFGVKTR